MANHKNKPWSATELAALRKYYPGGHVAKLMKCLPGRTWNGAMVRASCLGILNGAIQPWKDAEVAILMARYEREGAARLAPVLNRSPGGVGRKARGLGLHYDYRHMQKPVRSRAADWPDEILAQLDALFPLHSIRTVAKMIGRKQSSVRMVAEQRELTAFVPAVLPRKLPPPRTPRPGAAKGVKATRTFCPTPNLDEQKARRKNDKKVTVSVTAAYISTLPYASPERRAYDLNGRAGWESYQKLKQAA